MRIFTVTLAALLATACSSDEPDDELPAGTPTYYADVKPILESKCTGCHYDGGIAPFSLIGYDDAKVHSGVSKLALEAGIMPPWPPEDGCNDYHGDRSLTDAQLTTFIDWVDAGSPEGDPDDEGEPIPYEGPELSRVDASLTMAEPYTPALEPDDYRCFLIPWPEEYDTTTYVTGFRAVPGNDAIVHHVIAFLATAEQAAAYYEMDAAEDGPGYTCFGGTSGPARAWLGGWAPGGLGSDLPAGTGIEVQPGSMIVLQVHYNTIAGDPEPDTTSIDLKIDDSVERVARVMPWANPQWLSGDNMLIPANEPDVMHSWAFDPTAFLGMESVEIHTAGLHMHTLGTAAELAIERAAGGTDCLLDIGAWDFDWQGSYELRAPVRLDRGDQLRLECHWDNTSPNQPVINGQPQIPRDVAWGEGTTDEMCLGIVLVTESI